MAAWPSDAIIYLMSLLLSAKCPLNVSMASNYSLEAGKDVGSICNQT